MKNISVAFSVSLLAVSLTSCFRPDVPQEAFVPNGESTVRQIEMAMYDPAIDDTRYTNQVFIDLGTETITSVDRSSWDLGFETEGDHVILNSANYMQVAYSDEKSFGEAWTESDKEQLVFGFDSATGNLEYTAIGNWWEHPGRVFLIDRGFDNETNPRGFQQLQIMAGGENDFTIRLANENGTNQREVHITKSIGHNFAFLSLKNDKIVSVEPFQEDWDLVFGYYSYRYPDGFPYWLTGALHNRFKVTTGFVESDSVIWDSLTLQDTLQVNFRNDIDEIGFDWKAYQFGPPARYVTFSEQLYLLKDTEGYYYKLRFLDFYNEDGLKGFPQVEFALLR